MTKVNNSIHLAASNGPRHNMCITKGFNNKSGITFQAKSRSITNNCLLQDQHDTH